jgi:hypothetical protein
MRRTQLDGVENRWGRVLDEQLDVLGRVNSVLVRAAGRRQ